MAESSNPTPPINEAEEKTFREKAVIRMQQDHSDLPPERLSRWMELLHDDDPHGRVFAATAAWAMMEVRDSRKQRSVRSQNAGTLE